MLALALSPQVPLTTGPLSQRAAVSASITAIPALPQGDPVVAKLASGKVSEAFAESDPVNVFLVMSKG